MKCRELFSLQMPTVYNSDTLTPDREIINPDRSTREGGNHPRISDKNNCISLTMHQIRAGDEASLFSFQYSLST